MSGRVDGLIQETSKLGFPKIQEIQPTCRDFESDRPSTLCGLEERQGTLTCDGDCKVFGWPQKPDVVGRHASRQRTSGPLR
jgi:hypothetical protein